MSAKKASFIKYAIIVGLCLLLLYIGVNQFNKWTSNSEATNKTLLHQWKHWGDSVTKASNEQIKRSQDSTRQAYAEIAELNDSVSLLHMMMAKNEKEFTHILKATNEKVNRIHDVSTDGLKQFFTDRYGNTGPTETNR